MKIRHNPSSLRVVTTVKKIAVPVNQHNYRPERSASVRLCGPRGASPGGLTVSHPSGCDAGLPRPIVRLSFVLLGGACRHIILCGALLLPPPPRPSPGTPTPRHCLHHSFARAPANLPGNEELFPLDDRLGFEQCCNRPQSQQLRGMQARITDPWRSRLELPPSPRSTTPAHLPLERAPSPSLTYRLPLLQVEAPAAACPPTPVQKAGSPRPVGAGLLVAAGSHPFPRSYSL